MKERGRKRKKKTGERVIRNEGGGQVVGDGGGELTAMVVAGRKNIVTAAIPFMTSL